MWTFYELKSRAKEVLKTSYWKSLLAMVICSAIGNGITVNMNTQSIINPNFSNIESAILNNLGLFTGIFSSIVVSSLLVSVFLTNPLSVGQIRFFNESARGRTSIQEIFYPFLNGLNNYLNIVKVEFFKTLFLFLWGMAGFLVAGVIGVIIGYFANITKLNVFLPVLVIYIGFIPMLIKTYQYFFVEYILTDEPDIQWREAIKKSKEMTDGNKLRMFLLSLSFFGWLTLGILCFGIGVIFVMPYIQATFTQLYLSLDKKQEQEYNVN